MIRLERALLLSFQSYTISTMTKQHSNTMSSLAATKSSYPSSLTGLPVKSLVPPNICQFGSTKTAVPLLARWKVSSNVALLRFGLPDGNQPLNLATCACILAHANVKTRSNGQEEEEEVEEDVTRPYTPISTNTQTGTFDLLVKSYGKHGKMSRHLVDEMAVSEKIAFTHTEANIKIQAPFDANHILMLAGGTGITPMLQALHAILGEDGANNNNNNNDKTDENKKKNNNKESSSSSRLQEQKVTLLFGNQKVNDILAHDLLQKWTKAYPTRFNVVHVLSDDEDEDPSLDESEKKKKKNDDNNYERGFIDEKIIRENFPLHRLTHDKMLAFVCGPPPMYDALCGPRDEPDQVKGVLGDLGFTPEQVFKF